MAGVAVPEAVAKWLHEDEEGPQVESVAEMAKLWNASNIETGPVADVLSRLPPEFTTTLWGRGADVTNFKARKLVGELQAAWDSCCNDLSKPRSA